MKPTSITRRRVSPVGVVVAIATVLFFLGAGVASAHVTVNPNEAAAGSYAKITFRVPTESATASTVALEVKLPTEHPFPSVSVMPVPGWTAMPTVTTFDQPVVEGRFNLTEATSSVTWTAQDGNGIAPGEFQEFSLSVGPVPDVASITLPSTQTYSDGSVVEWKDVAGPGVDPHSLDHPAPVLTITSTTAGDTAADDTAAGDTAASSSDTTALILGAVALVIAALALLFAVLGWRRGTTRKDTHDVVPAAEEQH